MGGLMGWECSKCTYYHQAPGTRCAMCDSLRVTKQQMRDFISGESLKRQKEERERTQASASNNAKPSAKENLPPTDASGVSGASAAVPSNHSRGVPVRNPYAKKAAVHALAVPPSRQASPATQTSTLRPPSTATISNIQNPYASHTQPSGGTARVATASYSTAPTVTAHHASLSNQNVPSSSHPSLPHQPTSNRVLQQGKPPPPPTAPAAVGQPVQPTPFPVNQTTPAAHPLTQRTAAGNKRPRSNSASQQTMAQKQDIWTRSIAPPRPVYAPGPVPLFPETSSDWIYPVHKDFPVRDYQLEISKTAIFQNTLVSLPTGLGKTLIAAVVLYNYYRWFPTGKVLFLAPTLPLVNQQIRACYDIMGIPAEDTAILTGKVVPRERKHLWDDRRVFFCTPQTVQHDITAERCPASLVVCVVMDEAHKACGDYAYTRVVKQLEKSQAKFRVLGLSATPGSEIKAIQNVVTALRIHKIEARLDDDASVKKYIHERHSEIIVVKQASAVSSIERLMNNLIAPVLDDLRKANALPFVRGNATLTPYCIIRAKEDHHLRTNDHRMDAHFRTAHRLVDIRSHLHRTGIGMVRSKMIAIRNNTGGLLSSVVRGKEFQAVMDAVLRASNPNGDEQAEDRKLNNPKLMKLYEILKEHFERARACGESSRAIVFSQWRESVSEIVHVLSASQPLLRPRHFVGQGKSSAGSKNKKGNAGIENNNCASLKGMKQSEQQHVIKEFQEGHFNILVCTCIGEEGLDIGEVDLIVNYDTLRSPIRMIQRVGRTGRKRDGRVVCLVSEGAEEKTMRASKAAEKTLGRALKRPTSFQFVPNVPMFPKDPELRKVDMSVSASFRMSQVGGNGPLPKNRGASDINKKRESLEAADAWKLSDDQECKRLAMFGEIDYISCLDLRSADGRLPMALKRRFMRGRTRAMAAKQDNTVGLGTTLKILRAVEGSCGKASSHRPKIRHVCGSSRRRGRSVVTQLFPLEKVPLNKLPMLTARKLPQASAELSCQVADQESRTSSQNHETDSSATNLPPSQSVVGTTRASSDCQMDSIDAPKIDGSTDRTPLAANTPCDTRRGSSPTCFETKTVPGEEFILPTPPDTSSSSDDSESEDESDDARGRAPKVSSVPSSPRIRQASDSVPEGKGLVCSDTPVRDLGESPRDIHPVQALQLPTQDSSSDDESGDEDEDDVSLSAAVSEELVTKQTCNTNKVAEVELRAESSGDSCDLVDTPETLSVAFRGGSPMSMKSSALSETPEVVVKAARKNQRNVILTQAPMNTLSSNDGTSEHMSRCLPHNPSAGDCLVDTPEARDSAERDASPAATIAPASDDAVEDVVCGICFCGESPDSDPIVLCDGPNNDYSCHVSVHRSCYSISACLEELDHWRCDFCESKHGKETSVGVSVCQVCESKDGPLQHLDARIGSNRFVHPYCKEWATVERTGVCDVCLRPGAVSCAVSDCGACAHPHCGLNQPKKPWTAAVGAPSRNHDRLQGSLFCPTHTTEMRKLVKAAGYNGSFLKRYIDLRGMFNHSSITNDTSDVELREAQKRKRLMKKSAKRQADSGDEPGSGSGMKRQRIVGRTRERHLGMLRCRFLETEAGIASDEDVDGDEGDEHILQRIEEEEAFYDDFINDTSQLGHATQDDLDRIDPSSDQGQLESVSFHRALDAEKERIKLFATPILNRRLKKRSRLLSDASPGSDSGHEWDEPTPASAPSSQKGLGNMHFIRSVLEHHRNGGDADEIEAVYHALARENDAESEDESRPQAPANPNGLIVMKYSPSDSEDSDDEQTGGRAGEGSAAFSSISKDQLAMIEARRQEALRRRRALENGTL